MGDQDIGSTYQGQIDAMRVPGWNQKEKGAVDKGYLDSFWNTWA
jgi:hypothetical protein